MTSRSDTRFASIWIARPAALWLAGCVTLLATIEPARAQILGNQSPGAPGTIEGELRTRPTRIPDAARVPVFSPPDPETEGAPASRRSGVRRNPNAAIRRQIGSGQNRSGGFAGASPAGGSGIVRSAPGLRSARDLSGTSFSTNAPDAGQPPTTRPAITSVIAPGLPAPPPIPQRRQRPEDDPYAPLGIRAGSMILRPAIEIDSGYDTNANRTANGQGSAFWRTEGELAATSDWSRHQLDVGLRGSYTGFTSLSAANRPEGDARIALRLDATRDLAIDSTLTARVDTERPGSVNLPGGTADRVPFYTLGANLGGTQRFGRLSVGLRATLDRSIYEDVTTGGVRVSQEDRNLSTLGIRTRLGYEITPGLTPFAEAGIDRRTYDLRLDSGGFARDSQGANIRAGTTFELARTLTGEASLGYTFRAYEDARLQALRAPLVDAALTWSISPLTTLNVRAQSEIAETTLASSSGALVYRGTAALTHAFLRNFTATATLGFARSEFDGVDREETTLNAGLRFEYRFSRLLAARASYAFERYSSNVPGDAYTTHVMLFGLRLTR